MQTPVHQQKPIIVQIPAAEKKPSKINYNTLATSIFGLTAVLLTLLAHSFYPSIKQFLCLKDAKFKTFNQQFKLITELAYIFSVFLLAVMAIVFLFTHISQTMRQSALMRALRRVISDSFEKSLIFFGLFAYLVTQKGKDTQKKQIVLIANLFLYGRYLYLFGSIVQAKTGINLKQIGVVLTTIVYALLLSEITGIDIPFLN